MQDIFAYAKFRSFSVCTVRSVLSGGALYIGYRNEILPLVTLVSPLYVGFGSLHLYVFGINAVLAVGTVNSVNAVFAVNTVLSVNAVNAVLSVGAVNAVFSVCSISSVDTVLSVCSVLAVFSGGTTQLGKCHKVAPFFFGGVSPLDRRAAIAHLRQCGTGFFTLPHPATKTMKSTKSIPVSSFFPVLIFFPPFRRP